MYKLTFAVFLLVAGSFTIPAQAIDTIPRPIARAVPDAAPVGMGELHYLFFHIYDATLYAPGGQWRSDRPYALSLTYKRELGGPDIAQRSLKEMQLQGQIPEETKAKWLKEMTRIFPDVKRDMVLTGIHTKKGHIIFYKNNMKAGEVRDSEFTTRFFDIWLSEKTSIPQLRAQLLGGK